MNLGTSPLVASMAALPQAQTAAAAERARHLRRALARVRPEQAGDELFARQVDDPDAPDAIDPDHHTRQHHHRRDPARADDDTGGTLDITG